jgi:predicted ATPase/class 3 adenylate cyclase/DNA-binding CsgD family transcriptional regulator
VLPEGVVTFLMTDIEGSTRLWETHPDAMPLVIQRHYELLDAAIVASSGWRPLEQGEGDSVVAVFNDPADAIACAVVAQRALHNEQWPDGVDLKVRIAIHTGRAEMRDTENYVGPSIIRCARLRACAHGGQILVSDTAASLVDGRLAADVALTSLGTHRLKDLDAPERVSQVVASGLTREFPPMRSLGNAMHNLPAEVTPLLCREPEIAALLELLDEPVVTLTGAGGVGKTRLALAVAAEARDHFVDGAWWVDLAVLTDPAAVPGTVLRALGGEQQAPTSTVDQLTALLASESMLLILDNCEHLLDASAELVARINRTCPSVRVLATSREPLGIAGEITWRVPSLSVPSEDRQVDTSNYESFDALRLYWERARRARPNIIATDELVEASAHICRRLDGIPLAIELAAARCRHLSPTRVAQELDEHFRLLAGSDRSRLPRQRTLQASVEWSCSLLDEDERIVFRRLGVLIGSFPIEAAEGVVVAMGDLDAWSVLDLVTRLVDKSLLVDEVEDEPHYRMLETVRFHALEQARAAGELAALREASAKWWADRLTIDDPNELTLDAVVALGDTDYGNLRASLEWFADRPGDAVPIVMGLGYHWGARGLYDDYREFGPPIVHALRDADDPRWAQVAAGLAWTAFFVGDLDFVLGPAMDAFEVLDATGDYFLAGQIVGVAAFLHGTSDAWDRLQNYGERHELEDLLLARAYGHIVRAPELPTAIDGLDALADWARTRGTLHFQNVTAVRVGFHLIVGDLDDADTVARAALAELPRQPASPERWLLANAALLALYRDDTGNVATIVDRCRSRALRHLPVFWDSTFRMPIALADHRFHGTPIDVDEIAELLAAPINTAQAVDSNVVLGRFLLEHGRVDAVMAAADQIARADHGDAPIGQLRAGELRARAAQHKGDTDAAEREWRALLELAAQQEARICQINALEGVAVACADSPEYAARLFAASASGRAAHGYRLLFPGERARIDAVLARCATEERARCEAEGRSMDLDAATAYASRGRGSRDRPTTGWQSLTPTEVEVATLVQRGATNPEIARTLVMSVNTVKTHIAHMFSKLDITSRAELAAIVATRSRES